MKRFVIFFLMLILLLTCFPALAEGDGSVSPTAYIEQPTIQPNATREVYLENSVKTIYTCPVRKRHITVTFANSDAPTAVQVRLRTYDAASGYWDDATVWVTIPLGQSYTFDLTQPAKYEVQVAKVQGTDTNGYCTFYITATA